jgi:alkanesulfonate monooxygenase SsuD/methylene tetrahydromethanopterin reductase-like flavin-dependent oxidoreductase (luciferase family)
MKKNSVMIATGNLAPGYTQLSPARAARLAALAGPRGARVRATGMSYLPGTMADVLAEVVGAVPIRIGVSFPDSIMPGMPLPDIAGLATVAERSGLDGVWVADRLTAGELSVLDSTLTLAVAAAVTSSITVGYAAYVPSLRPLTWAAKQIATVQHIAGGRLELGVVIGAGGDAEYLAAGFRRSDRAGRTDEFLALLPDMLAGRPLPRDSGGSADALRLLPTVPMPPLWVGGTSVPALRRAVRFGTGWLSGLQTPREFAASRQQLLDLSRAAGRPMPLTGIGLHAAIGTGSIPDLTQVTAATMHSMYGLPADRAREIAIAGTPAQVAAQLGPYAEAGADLIVVVCDPAPSPRSWELLAEARHLLNR